MRTMVQRLMSLFVDLLKLFWFYFAGKISYNDDEPIVAGKQDRGRFLAGKIKLTTINKAEAPLEETKFKLMLELIGSKSGESRTGVDLVTVLDVSDSMEGDLLDKMKLAMQFLIKKLRPIDRLSVVTFAEGSMRLCPFREMNENSQVEIGNMVSSLVAKGSTNITAGLEAALKVIGDRKFTEGRVAAIMLMSDGEQNDGDDAAEVPVGDVPVYTFGFGKDYHPQVLKAIARNSNGGTFSDVQYEDNLIVAFSQCLAGLLTVVVQDLTLTITQEESTIKNVSIGNYPQEERDTAGSVTVSLGDLYDKEPRKVIVELLLPPVSKPTGENDVLQVTYSYRAAGGARLFTASPVFVTVTRVETSVETENEEVMNEESRLRATQMVKEARIMADDGYIDDARNKLIEAEDAIDKSNFLLQSELQQLFRLMKSKEIYEEQGRSFALSSEVSHDRQRFATRGDVKKLRLFATPRMNTYLWQAKSFGENPGKAVATVEEDVKQELVGDRLGSIDGALSYYKQTAVQSLKSIEYVLNSRDL